jgi:flagellin-like hook-associated protein FlgL
MGLSVATNLSALTAYHALSRTSGSMDRSLQRLSSGYRINRASDDAAGLGISEGLRSQARGMSQAIRNAQDGISVVQTADGGLQETGAILRRMRDLAVQGANDGALDDDARANIQKEVGQLKAELTQIAHNSQWNGTSLLDGTYQGTFQVGANTGETVTISIGGAYRGMDAVGLGVSSVDVTGNVTVPSTVVPAVSDDSGTPAAATMVLGGDYTTAGVYPATFKHLDGTIDYNGKTFDLGTVDYTGATTATEYLTALNNAAAAALGVSASSFIGSATGLQFTGDVPATGSTDADAALLTPSYTGKSGASAAIPLIDKATRLVSAVRADLGAFENRLEHTVKRLSVAVENTQASDSRIRDTDMASEMAGFSKAQILTQAGSAMLAQATQAPQSILKLLSG